MKYDFGANVEFESHFSIHQIDHYKDLISVKSNKDIGFKSNSFELYFESDDIEQAEKKLKAENVEFIHELVEQSWRQRVVRVYDYDGHIVEVGESMDSVIFRYYNNGMSVEEIAQKTSMPVGYIEKLV